MRLGGLGLEVDLPKGWEGQIRPAKAPAHSQASPGGPRAAAAAPGLSTLHAANFALPAERGDYGSGAVEVMGGSHVLVCVLEHDPSEVDTPLFSRVGVPTLKPSTFSPQSMQRAIQGMAGCQQFFQLGGRAFCLYVVVGSSITRGPLVKAADQVVKSIRATPRS